MTVLLRRALPTLLLALSPAVAQEPQYGYVVGTLNPAKSYLEKLDAADKGKYLHYHIFLTTDANVEYQCVIDVNDVLTKPLIYRIASLDGQSSAELATNFGPIFSATGDYHPISNSDPAYGAILTPSEADRKAAGALDYLRHPGILKALQGQPWQQTTAQKTSDPLQLALPEFDNLFKPFSSPFPMVHVWTKVYVFGGPFTPGTFGMHVVHQNQADTGPGGYAAKNGVWQDGAVIVERHVSMGIDGPPHVYRSIVMVKFANQTDFTAESNDVTKPALPGHVVAPTTQTYTVSGLVQNHTQTFGPIYATQLDVSTLNASANPNGPGSYPRLEVAVKNGAFTSDADPGDFVSTDYAYASGPSYRAYARAYAPLWVWYFGTGFPPRPPYHPIDIRGSYYVRVKTLDSGGYGGSSASATVSVSKY
jgi:hypothetical protein